MNSFDAAIILVTAVAVVMGYKSGLLRSLATIFGYLAAMPAAVAIAPWPALMLIKQFSMPLNLTWWLALAGTFLVIGIVLGALLRRAVGVAVGPGVSVPDRVAGALLGAVRIALLAVLMVLIFDRIIPPDREPAFLANSQLRPFLSKAGQQGLRSLPPDIATFIDRLKQKHGI